MGRGTTKNAKRLATQENIQKRQKLFLQYEKMVGDENNSRIHFE